MVSPGQKKNNQFPGIRGRRDGQIRRYKRTVTLIHSFSFIVHIIRRRVLVIRDIQIDSW